MGIFQVEEVHSEGSMKEQAQLIIENLAVGGLAILIMAMAHSANATQTGEPEEWEIERTVPFMPGPNMDGSIEEGPVVDGKRNGRWVIKEGDVVWEGPYVDGKMNGHWVITLPDGTVWEGEYVDDKESGLWVIKFPDGTVIEAGRYVDGVKQ